MKPGIHTLNFNDYKAAKGVSKSMLDVIAEKTPAHLLEWMAVDEDETEAQRFGTILHRALLEPDTYRDAFHVRPEGMKFTTKDGIAWRDGHQDRPIISLSDANQITSMVDSVHTHPFAKRLLVNAQTEQNIFVEDKEGTLRKSRLDAMTAGNIIPDIKTCESASLDQFERSVSRYRYHVQAAYYLDNCNLLGIEKEIFFFICVEKSPPYAVRCLQLMGDVINAGAMLYRRDLQIYRNCIESGHWPAWGDSFEECGLPIWEMKQLEQLAE